MNDKDSMSVLRALDEGTEWEQSGDVLSVNDPDDDDDGMAGVPSRPHLYPIDGGAVAEVDDSMDRAPTVAEILDTIAGMSSRDDIEDLLVVVNTPDGDQHLMTTIDRNDHIIGCLTVASLNWHSSQIASLNYYDEEED